MSDIAVAALLLSAAVLSLTAGIGLLHFPDLLSRLHTATKPQVVGLLAMLVAVGLRVEAPFAVGILVLTGLFQLITAPVAAHMTGRAAYRSKRIETGRLSRDDLAHDLSRLGGATRRDTDDPPHA
ncbi:monovalent cation/H(+) antiporter subunit G [Thermostaphylospora chromogena]|uniref:Multisubunit sodium/proton antiporter, MrpG subunit n=1 Tax=Thermostaphylospora chromogena TaxID=35622 RepID=A0A1H1CBL7_9ACTN|nr:monovalent cation/H(+) antiporter subunit G [Thermostaphylospora chromogena]SDQ61607.1 multisubunit sodium/proton antiporter, MrpG subunit [Thermostaphylospora chromogena]